MNDFMIVTDTASDLPADYIEKNKIELLSLGYIVDGRIYNWYAPMDEHEFYDAMRNGSMPTTSQVTVNDALQMFEKLLKRCNDILCISFSSELSGTYSSTALAAWQIREANPDAHIRVIDSKSASLGQGLMVDYAVRMKNEGKSMDEIADDLEQNYLHFSHIFTVDDLFHLHRGGRVSKATAILGSLAKVKPILHVDDEGRLINIGKVRGRKKSLQELVRVMEQKIGSYTEEKQTIFISHGDCLEDAQYVAELVKEKFGFDSFLINYVGPTIGAHTGPGVVALFFRGESR